VYLAFLALAGFCFLRVSHEIGWKECVQTDQSCVELDVKPHLSESTRHVGDETPRNSAMAIATVVTFGTPHADGQ